MLFSFSVGNGPVVVLNTHKLREINEEVHRAIKSFHRSTGWPPPPA